MKRVILLLGVVILHLVVCTPTNAPDPIAATLQSLKEKEKEEFLAYVLGLSLLDWAKNQPRPPKFLPGINDETFLRSLNISDEKIDEYQKIDIPPESREKLLTWTKSEFGLTGKDVLMMIRTKKCQGRNCVGLGDLGPLCCPW